MRRDFFVGADLGQSQDPTALALVERAEYRGNWNAVNYAYDIKAAINLRYLVRLPLGTTYPNVVGRIQEVMGSKTLESGTSRHLVVDATGVGRPVIDLLQAERMPCRLWPVTITSGTGETFGTDGYKVPKRDLIVGVQLMLQNGELNIASGLADGEALKRELSSMRVSMTAGGREKFGAQSGEHDDLVLAVALAVWGLKKVTQRKTVGERGERLVF
jgi:hypothetical protein